MDEVTVRPSELHGWSVRFGSVSFYPSHLTKGLVASVISLGFGVYALRQFSQVPLESNHAA